MYASAIQSAFPDEMEVCTVWNAVFMIMSVILVTFGKQKYRQHWWYILCCFVYCLLIVHENT